MRTTTHERGGILTSVTFCISLAALILSWIAYNRTADEALEAVIQKKVGEVRRDIEAVWGDRTTPPQANEAERVPASGN